MSSTRHQLKFFRVLGTAFTLAIIGACSSSDSDESESVPSLTITNAPSINIANAGSYGVSGTCIGGPEEENPVVKVVLGSKTLGSPACEDGAWAVSDHDVSTIEDSKSLKLTVTEGEEEVSRTLIKDVIAPGVTMTSSLLVGGPNVNPYPMAGACDENGTGVVSLTIAGGTAMSVDCQGRNWQKNVNLISKDEGNISVSITHEDALGNGTTITRTLNKDTLAPTLTITPPAMMNSANQNAYTIRGTCNEEGTQITVSIAGRSTPLPSTCASSAWQVSGNFTSLVDNAQIGVTASVQDRHGNRSEKTASFAKDATLPEVTINTPAELTDDNKVAFPLTGSCNENRRDVLVSANTTIPPVTITPASQPTCQSSGWTMNIDLRTLRGDITIRAHQIDASGNRGDAPVKIILGEGKTFLHLKISSGELYSCALNSSGNVLCWGDNTYGQLGNNATENSSFPVQVVGPDTTGSDDSGDGVLGNIVQISTGRQHACALNSSGNVLCWGIGDYGRLGNNATENSSFPVQVVGPDTDSDNSGDGVLGNIVQISGGASYTCALNSSGNVLCWGSGRDGKLGDDSTSHKSYPVFVVQSDGSTTHLSGVVQLSAGADHSCVLTSAETVLCWGLGQYGQLGSSADTTVFKLNNVGVSRDAPLAVLTGGEQGDPLLSGITQVASGRYHTCALTFDGHVKCWGRRFQGALGDNGVVTADQSWFPVNVVGEDIDGSDSGNGLLSNIVQITLGDQYACALNAEGKVWCWGNGENGKLGTGSTGDKNYPVSVIAGSGSSSPLSGIAEMASSSPHTLCALSEEGRVLCWGVGGLGALGYGGTSSQSSPVTVIPASGSTDFLNIGTYRGSYTCKGGVCALDTIGLSLAANSPSPSTGASPSIEVSGIGTGKMLNLYSSADCSATSKGTASSPSGTIALSSLASEGAYKYYFDITDSSSKRSNCSKSFISYIYDSTAPSAPALSFDPTNGADTTPDIRVSAITPGDLVQVYSDSGCTTLAAPATRVDGVSRDITLNAISGMIAHSFYATATDAAGNVSACSAAATYTLESL